MGVKTITVTLLTRNKQYDIPRISFEYRMGRSALEIRRVQFPLKLAYAVTFNKSQGQTLNRVMLDLTDPTFAHGKGLEVDKIITNMVMIYPILNNKTG